MNSDKKTLKTGLFLISIFLIASACNLVSNIVNPVEDVISEAENIATQVNVEDLEDLGEEIQTAIPEIPTDLGDLQETMEAVGGGFDFGEVPADIPVVEAENENLFGSEEFVSYMTGMSFEEVLAFYQDEMPANGWTPKEGGDVITEDVAVLYFSKPDKDASVSMSVNPADEQVVVLITILPK